MESFLFALFVMRGIYLNPAITPPICSVLFLLLRNCLDADAVMHTSIFVHKTVVQVTCAVHKNIWIIQN